MITTEILYHSKREQRRRDWIRFLSRQLGGFSYLATKEAQNLATMALCVKFPELWPEEARRFVEEWNGSSVEELRAN